MGSEQIVLWLDEPKYEAIQRILNERGTDLETVMQARLAAYYLETVPVQERIQINQAMEAARLAEAAEQEARRQFNVYRVREGGETTCFESELCINEVRAAARLRAFIRQEWSGAAGVAALYADLAQQKRVISEEQFADRANAFWAGTQNVHGVFAIDMDAGTFTFLDRERGWRRYAVKDVSTAAYHAFRMDGRSENWARQIFDEKLLGKELPLPTCRLTEKDVSFSEEITEVCGKLNFYMDVIFDPDAVFGTHVATSENGDWLNVYANYDMEKKQVCGELDLMLHRDNGQDQELHYTLDDAEKAILLAKMDAYCMERDGVTLEQLRAQMLEEQGPDPEQGMGPLQ